VPAGAVEERKETGGLKQHADPLAIRQPGVGQGKTPRRRIEARMKNTDRRSRVRRGYHGRAECNANAYSGGH
jgi:hypothetical protein